jgi:truncated hemoglobin YjbI
MIDFRSYQPGEHILYEDALYEVVRSAFTRWGSPTYQLRALGTDDAKRWLTPERGDAPIRALNRAAIRTFVEAFYRAVDRDPLLGPVFERRIHGNWDPHLDTMVKFWSAVLLREPGYQGQPPVVHRAVGEIRAEHFERWLELFRATVESLFDPALAAHLVARSEGIAQMLSAAVLGKPWNA